MGRYSFGSRKEIIKKKGLTIDKFKEILKELCDEDFNGRNGKDYFIPVEDDNGKEILKSRFDATWDELVFEDTNPCDEGWDIAERILEEAYSYNTEYYIDYTVEVINNPDEIIIFVAYMDCV